MPSAAVARKASPLAGFLQKCSKLPLILAAISSLAVAVWLGLIRVGWDWPVPVEDLPSIHGSLIVCGFIGTVIGVERAAALRRWWAWTCPALSAAGAVTLVLALPGALDLSPKLPRALFAASATMLLVTTLVVAVRQRALFTAILATGAACFAAGNTLWTFGLPLFKVVPWWMGFIVLTVAAERLEMSRLTNIGRSARACFAALAAALVAALVLSVFRYPAGFALEGGVFVGLAIWMLLRDVARKTVRIGGLPRFAAVALLSGHAWLLVGGALLAWKAHALDALGRDASYHSVFLGFVMSMIFAHAPIVAPSIGGPHMKYSTAFYAPLVLLQSSLALRVISDLALWLPGREWGAIGNASAILLEIVVLAVAALRYASEARSAGFGAPTGELHPVTPAARPHTRPA